MRLRRLAIALPLLAGCAAGGRARPYRFASPLIGAADVPPAPLLDPLRAPPLDSRDVDRHGTRLATGSPGTVRTERSAGTDGPDRTDSGDVRSASAPTIRVASAAAADAIVAAPAASEDHRDQLPAPNRLGKDAPLPLARSPEDLRALVGYRDARGPLAATLALAAELRPLDESGILALAPASGAELVAWADSHDRLRDAHAVAAPGDLLVFDHTDSADLSDRIALVIARDARGVTEFLYLGGGVWRRGFVDPTQPSRKRSPTGTVLNTYLRTGSRYPPKGTHYLAGELLAHVIAIR